MFAQHGLESNSMSLTVDHRERKVREILLDVPFAVADLPVGDFLCEYKDEPDKAWIAERKTTQDLSQSIKSGRMSEQTTRLCEFGKRVVIIVEGDIRRASLPCESLWGCIVNASMRKNFVVYRTWDVFETCSLVKMLMSKMANWTSGLPPGTGLMTSKRKRDSDEKTCLIKQLCCIPSVSENVGRALADHFGTLQSLQRALQSDEPFPKIALGRTCIGKDRVLKLRKYLCQ